MNYKLDQEKINLIQNKNLEAYQGIFNINIIKYQSILDQNFKVDFENIILEVNEHKVKEYLSLIISGIYLNTLDYIETQTNQELKEMALIMLNSMNKKINEMINISFYQLDQTVSNIKDKNGIDKVIEEYKKEIVLLVNNNSKTKLPNLLKTLINTMTNIFYNVHPYDTLIHFLEDLFEQLINEIQENVININKQFLNNIYNQFGINEEKIKAYEEQKKKVPFEDLKDENLYLLNITLDEEKALGILGLDSSATKRQIKVRYKQLVKQYHPDKINGDENKFILINRAWEVLKG